MNIFVTDPAQYNQLATYQTSTLSRCHSRLAKCCPSYTAIGITASANYTNQTAHHIALHTVHFATIHVHSGLPPTSTILHGSYDTAMPCVTSTTYVTARYILVLTLYSKPSVSITSHFDDSLFHTHHARSRHSHVPCQSLSSSTLLSTLSQRTNATSTPSRG